MAERLIPDNTLFSSLLKQNQGMSSEQVNQIIDTKINELVNQRMNGIIDNRIRQNNLIWSDTLPNGAVTPIGPHGFIFGQKWFPAIVSWDGKSNNRINQLSISYASNHDVKNRHDDSLAKIGILHVTDNSYNRDSRIKSGYGDQKYIIEDDFPIFFSYLKRINYPFEWINNKRSYVLYIRDSDRDHDTRSTSYTPTNDFYIYVGDAR